MGALTNQKNYSVLITDDSRVLTTIAINNVMTQTSSLKNLSFILNDGLNNVTLESTDSFGNKSVSYLTVTVDTIPAVLSSITPPSGTLLYTNTLPFLFPVTANYNKSLQSVFINGQEATLSLDKKVAQASVQALAEGSQQIQIVATDLAGNMTISSLSTNLIYSTVPPKINLSVIDGLRINHASYNLSFLIDSLLPTTTKIKVNDIEVLTSDSKNISYLIDSLKEGINIISISTLDAAGNTATPAVFSVILDTVPPKISTISPENGKSFYTNKLPFTIPISATFDKALSSAKVNGAVALLSGLNSVSSQIQVNSAGPVSVQIEVTDLAGNIQTVTENLNVAYSNIKPVITLNSSIVDLLTNLISFNVSGISDQILASVSLNGNIINLGLDGKSFSGLFQAPADGRFEINITATDIFGNMGSVSTFARVIQALPPQLVNYPPPKLDRHFPNIFTPNFGPAFNSSSNADLCGQLDQIFQNSAEFSENLRTISTVDPQPYVDKFPEGYQPNVPDIKSVQRFIGNVNEKLNYVKAGYLAVCKGYNFMPSIDCPTSRDFFRILMGEYPEPMIIRSIPGLDLSIQKFLIKRINICTGFDDSGLSCEDMISFLPFLSNFVIPGLGELLGSPVGQFVLENMACTEICAKPEFKDTPVCKDINLPKIPKVKLPTLISLTPPNINIPNFPGLNDWSLGDGGGSGCNWWKFCGSGSGGSGGSSGNDYFCSAFPGLWFCAIDPAQIPSVVTLDPNISCDAVNSLVYGDLFLPQFNLGIAPSTFLTSIIAKCSNVPVIGFPKTNPPVITVTAPIPQQSVTDTVRVTGFVSDLSSIVKIQGQVVATTLGMNGLYFDVTISVPQSGVVKVEAVDKWGNAAVPVEVGVRVQVILPIATKELTVAYNNACSIVQRSLKCLGHNNFGQLGNNIPNQTFRSIPTEPIGMNSDIKMVAIGFGHMCAIKDNAVYCWGRNDSGQLGIGTASSSFTGINIPTHILSLDGTTAISAGANFACALINGGVKCWGSNSHGQLGNGTFADSPAPVDVMGLTTNVKEIHSGYLHSCAILVDNNIKCWGAGGYGELGNGVEGASGIPVNFTVANNIKTISLGQFTTCFIDQNNYANCIGNNSNYELGNSNVPYSVTPIQQTSIGEVKYLTAGSIYPCVQDSNNQFLCWGNNFYKSLPVVGNSTFPTLVTRFPVAMKSVLPGYAITCGLSNNDDIYCLSQNYFGNQVIKVDGF